MSTTSASLFFNKLLNDDDFRAKASQCRTFRELFQFAENCGYDFDLGDLNDALPHSVKNAKINQFGTPVEIVCWMFSSGLYRGI
jgi:hypothetical protein